MKSNSNIRQGDNGKGKKAKCVIRVPMTCRLVLFYISTKYHKNIRRVFDLQSGHEINALSQSNITKGDNA